MRKTLLLIILSLLLSVAYAQSFQWAVQGGGSGSNSTSDRAEAVATDTQGNVIVTGIFEGTATFGTIQLVSAGSNDIFIAKYSPNGTCLWAVRAGGTQLDWPKAICTDKNNNIIITGQFSGTATFGTTSITASTTDIFVAKYNSSGVLQWVKKEGGTSVNRGLAVTTDTTGNVIVAGDFSGTATFGTTSLTSAGAADIFVMKYNASGTVQWAKRAGNLVNDRVTAVTTDNTGNIYVTGSFGGSVTFGSTPLSATGGNNDTDIFTAKYDAQGNILWAKKAGSNASVVEEGRGIAIDASNNIYITGLVGGNASFDGQNITSLGLSDAFLAKYNSSGTIQWVKNAGGTDDDEGTGVTVLPNGSICISGFYIGTATFGNTTINAFGGQADFDGFVASYTNTGNLKWVKNIGRNGEDRTTDVKAAIDNQIYAVGYFRNYILFDDIQLYAQGYSDAFLTQFNDFITINTLSSHTYCAGDIMQVDFNTSVNFNTGNEFTLWLSDENGGFANALNIGTLNAITSGSIFGALPHTLTQGSNYRIKIEADNFECTSAVYYTGITVKEAPQEPQPISQTIFCENDSLLFLIVDAQNVFWYADANLSSVIATGDTLITNLLLLNDTVFYCVQEGNNTCYSPLAEINIVVNPKPVIYNSLSDTTVLCENDPSYPINLMPSGGIFTGNGIIQNTNLFAPDVALEGFHTISYFYTDSLNCTDAYDVYFDVLPTPIVTIDTNSIITMLPYDTLFLTGTPLGGTFSGSGVTNNYFVANTNNLPCNPCVLFYTYQDANGCSDTASITVEIAINSIDENSSTSFMYPNPVSDFLYIKTKVINKTLLQISDTNGKLILERLLLGNDMVRIDVSDLKNGVYFIRLIENKDVIINKFIKY